MRCLTAAWLVWTLHQNSGMGYVAYLPFAAKCATKQTYRTGVNEALARTFGKPLTELMHTRGKKRILVTFFVEQLL